MTPHDLGRKAELFANGPYFVLEQCAKRLDELELQVVGKPANVVVALYVRGPGATTALDDVGIQRALNQELNRLTLRSGIGDYLCCGILEYSNELSANDLSLLLRVVDASQCIDEASLGVHDLQAYAGGGNEVLLDLFGLTSTEQPMVDEDTRELFANGSLHDRGSNCRVHAP